MQTLGDPWEHLRSVDIPAPQPETGMVRVRVEAADLNFADILQCQGNYQVKREPPFVPGISAAGTIVAIGDEVPLRVGDRVVGMAVDGWGGYGEEALLLAAQCTRIPDEVSVADAMAIHIAHGTTWFAFHHRTQIQPGETVLVLAAAGGVGSSAVQMARAAGCWVIAAAGGPEKVEFVRSLGADEVIDYSAESLYERVMELTDGRGVDVIYDSVGGEYFDISRRLLAWEGRLLVVGFASGGIPSAPANHLLVKNYSVIGVHMGGYRERQPEVIERCYEELHAQLAAGRIKPIISETIGFDALPSALLRLSQRGTTGRVIFDPRA